jgi:hypothetical protein
MNPEAVDPLAYLTEREPYAGDLYTRGPKVKLQPRALSQRKLDAKERQEIVEDRLIQNKTAKKKKRSIIDIAKLEHIEKKTDL